MALYAANENGDWWEIVDGEMALWFLNTSDLSAQDLEQLGQEMESDKFHKFIWQKGKLEIFRDN